MGIPEWLAWDGLEGPNAESDSVSGVVPDDGRVSLFGRKREILDLRARIMQLDEENRRARDLVERLDGLEVLQREDMIRRLGEMADERNGELSRLDGEIRERRMEIDGLNAQVVSMREDNELQEWGFFNYDNPAEQSVELSQKLYENKLAQKDKVRRKDAVHVSNSFTFNNSMSKGRTLGNDLARMALGMYNAEAENCVKGVKAGNLDSSVNRLRRCGERIDRFGRFIDLSIDWEYRRLRENELRLTAKYMQAVRAEKEAERERKAELREQAKAQKEIEAEMARLRKEQEHYRNVLEKMREQGNQEEAAKLEDRLAEIDKSINDVDYRAANIRAGYVYVISDVGAFGERMVKIGMTRRLDPMDRVRELSDASVPFRFDVHALFFSKDAVALETMLHHEFEDRRVNKVNARKEFYYCTPREVLDKLREKNVAVVEYRVEPEAEEYRMSRLIAERRERGQVVADGV